MSSKSKETAKAGKADKSNPKPVLPPIPLKLRTHYPSYQLYATAGPAGMDEKQKERAFKRCVLHTYKWLRDKFVNYDIAELMGPGPEDVDRCKVEDFTSFSLADPYQLEVVSLPKDGIWTMRLTEPDNGTKKTPFSAGRDPVIGRTFETNIGFAITEIGVECGFRTMVMDPVEAETDAESLRVSVVKEIARDPELALYHGFRFDDHASVAENPEDVRKIVKWIKNADRQVSVIVVDRAEESALSVPGTLPDFSTVQAAVRGGLADIGLQSRSILQKSLKELKPEDREINAEGLARYRMAYVQYFVVPAELSPVYLNELGDGTKPGVVSVFEPIAFGKQRWTLSSLDKFVTESWLDDYAHNAPGRKPMTFGAVRFVPAARELAQQHIAELAESKEAIVSAYESQIAAMKQRFDEERQEQQANILAEQRAKDKLVKDFEEERKQYRIRLQRLNEEHDAEIAKLRKEGHRDRKVVERLEVKERRPKNTDGIVSWVENEFAGKLIFHERAKRLMDDLKPGEFNADLLCDCLEYLACEYRDTVLGILDPDKANDICSKKYGRGFDVAPTGYTTTTQTPVDYKIKYFIGQKGKPIESTLNMHLRIGNTTGELVRIYFLFDPKNHLVVVGSLPKHLPTLSNS